MRHFAILLVLPVLMFAGEAAAGKDPSSEEILFLELLNQHRKAPAYSDMRIKTAIRAKQVPVESFSLTSWTSKATTKGSFPAIAFNSQLMEAARSLLKADTKPVDRVRFNAAPAIRAAGYKADTDSLAMFARDCPSIAIAYATALTNSVGDYKVGPGTVYLDFAGQLAIKGAWREAGVAVSAANGKFSVVVILGLGSAKRHLCGIAFADANRDGRYDSGEGKSGVKVSCGSASMTTSAGGAWWLAVDNLDAVDVTFAVDTFTAVRQIDKDAASVLVDWRIPNPADIKSADHLIAEAEKAGQNPDTDKRKGPLLALLAGTRLAVLDEARQKKVETLVEPIKHEFTSTMKKVLDALGEEPAEYKKRIADIQKPWKGAMKAWFKEAEAIGLLQQQVNTVFAAPVDQQGKLVSPVIVQLSKAIADSCDPTFREQYNAWKVALEEIPVTEAAPVKKK